MKLNLLYRKYLRGSDLSKPVTVEILGLKLVQVQPHPTAPKQDKWCVLVTGLPDDLPGAILVGPKGVDRLVKLFGNLDTEEIKGKKLELFPSPCSIGGVSKTAVGLRAPSNGKPSVTQPVAPPCEDPLPF